jgi:hypothetical protein
MGSRKVYAMKALALLCLALLPLSSSAGDAVKCKADFQRLASEYREYTGRQNAACLAQLNKPSAERSMPSILWNCGTVNVLSALRDRSSALCNECRSADEKMGVACSADEGLSKFLERIEAL